MASAEKASRKLTSLPRALVPQCYFQTPFLLPPPMEYFSLFSPNLILWLAIMTTALYYHNSVSFHKVTSKHLCPEVNFNFPYIVHSHTSHKTGEKNTRIYKHIHTCTHSHSFSGSSCLDFLITAFKRALQTSKRYCFSLIHPISQHSSILFLSHSLSLSRFKVPINIPFT